MSSRVVDAREYLADYLYEEDWHDDEDAASWFEQLGDYVRAIELADPRLVRAADCLAPFLDNDDRIDAMMYPEGEAITFIEAGWGGDLSEYLDGFLDALALDAQKWVELVRQHGDDAEWRST